MKYTEFAPYLRKMLPLQLILLFNWSPKCKNKIMESSKFTFSRFSLFLLLFLLLALHYQGFPCSRRRLRARLLRLLHFVRPDLPQVCYSRSQFGTANCFLPFHFFFLFKGIVPEMYVFKVQFGDWPPSYPDTHVLLREGSFCGQICLITFTPRLRRPVLHLYY